MWLLVVTCHSKGRLFKGLLTLKILCSFAVLWCFERIKVMFLLRSLWDTWMEGIKWERRYSLCQFCFEAEQMYWYHCSTVVAAGKKISSYKKREAHFILRILEAMHLSSKGMTQTNSQQVEVVKQCNTYVCVMWLEEQDERRGKSHLSEASFQALGMLFFLVAEEVIFFLYGSRVEDLQQQQAVLEEKMREDREALMDKLNQQATETASFKMENEKLKVSDSRTLKLKCSGKKGRNYNKLLAELNCTHCCHWVSDQCHHNLRMIGWQLLPSTRWKMFSFFRLMWAQWRKSWPKRRMKWRSSRTLSRTMKGWLKPTSHR